jgi:hypothetical protein
MWLMLATILIILLSSLPSQNTEIKTQTKILPVVLYGHEIWSLTITKEQRLRVSENRVLRRMFGPKRKEGAGGWRRMHNEELHNLYTSPNIIRVSKLRRMRWVGHVARMIDDYDDDDDCHNCHYCCYTLIITVYCGTMSYL